MSERITLNEARHLCEQMCDLVRKYHELLAEVADLQETLEMFAALRDLMANAPSALYAAAGNGHVALPRADAASESTIPLQVMAGGPDESRDPPPQDDPGAEGLEAMGADPPIGKGPGARAARPSGNPTDGDSGALQAEDDARAIPAPMPAEHDSPVSPSVEPEPGETAPGPTPWPVPDGPMDPVEASRAAAPCPSAAAERNLPQPGTLKARILEHIAQSVRPKRPWQLQRELGLSRLPSAELSKLTARGLLVRVREGCYGMPERDYK